eukprot:6591096-Pyramimonas_sp.AAC.1
MSLCVPSARASELSRGPPCGSARASDAVPRAPWGAAGGLSGGRPRRSSWGRPGGGSHNAV